MIRRSIVLIKNSRILILPIDFVSAPHERRHGAAIGGIWINAFRDEIGDDAGVTELGRQVYARKSLGVAKRRICTGSH